MRWLGAIERLVLTLWVGAIWSVGYLVAPVLFAMLDSRQLAGDIAGHLFHLVSYLGIACAAVFLTCVALAWKHTGPRLLLVTFILGMLCVTIVGEFYITPKMTALKLQAAGEFVSGSDLQQRFLMWHRLASGLFVVNSLLGLLAIVYSGTAQPARSGRV